MTRYIFLSCIADGPINWKLPLTAPGQPGIKDCHMIFTTERGTVAAEVAGTDSVALNSYAEAIASGAVVVGHSVEYHHGHLRAELLKRGSDPCDGRVQTICTMLALTGHVTKRNGRKGWPTFDEACDHFGITRAGTETAEDNCRSLFQMFGMMERAGIETTVRVWKDHKAK